MVKETDPQYKHLVERKHGKLDYYLTQFLPGRFNSYLSALKIKNNEECVYWGQTDRPEHTGYLLQKT